MASKQAAATGQAAFPGSSDRGKTEQPPLAEVMLMVTAGI